MTDSGLFQPFHGCGQDKAANRNTVRYFGSGPIIVLLQPGPCKLSFNLFARVRVFPDSSSSRPKRRRINHDLSCLDNSAPRNSLSHSFEASRSASFKSQHPLDSDLEPVQELETFLES